MSARSPAATALLAICAAATYACTGSPGTVASDPTGPGPAHSFYSGPQAPGPVVFRTTDDLGVFFIPDDRSNLTAYIGVQEPVSVFCNFALPITITPMQLQMLLKPNGELGWHAEGEDLPIYIYDLSTIDFCSGELSDDRIIATGTVRLGFVDRNFELPDPNVEPSYGYNATGTVTYLNGATARVSGSVRWKTAGAPGTRAHSHLQLTRAR
jgi:hypothetical protein